MTSELDGDMTRVERGEDTEEHVVTHSRALLAGVLDELLKHTQELGDAISDAVTADARVGARPKCGKDLVMKTSAKTRGSFIGCMGWPDCDVTYPVPSGVKVSPLEGEAAVPRVRRAAHQVPAIPPEGLRDLREPHVPHQLRARS